MNPYLTQAIAAERVADFRREAAAYRRARRPATAARAAGTAAGTTGRPAVRQPEPAVRPRPGTAPRLIELPAQQGGADRLDTVRRTRQASDQARSRLAGRRASHAVSRGTEAEAELCGTKR
jgi:hypothetical protein